MPGNPKHVDHYFSGTADQKRHIGSKHMEVDVLDTQILLMNNGSMVNGSLVNSHPSLHFQLRYVGREVSAVPAAGVGEIHQQEAKALVDATFS